MASVLDFGQETTAEDVAKRFSSRITGKTILITGVSPNGLGAAACRALAPYGPAVIIMTARDPSKPRQVADSILTSLPAGSTPPRLKVVGLDLSSLTSVRRGAAIIQRLAAPHIDIMINNAGVMALPERMLAEETHVEMHLAVNFLGHFLLTTALLPQLCRVEAAAAQEGPLNGGSDDRAARVVNITSAGFNIAPFRFSDYNFEGRTPLPPNETLDITAAEAAGFHGLKPDGSGYLPFLAYLQSNVAKMLFTEGLVERYGRNGIEALSASPGVVVTDLQRHLPKDFRNPRMFYKTPSQGVASFLVAALDPALSVHPAAYIDDCQLAETVEHVRSKSASRRLWQLAEDLSNPAKY
ncbi:Oxidoreductase [Pleurostoma richardsiae]|uniref:Oxidoreductase n=1 Tax=Pleurostoma richardsiae TaxID=41990 RepID=A0AA38R9X9_9PEZI|nr:Oxidoreductase [Pleurostoma richardsiae]